MRPNPQFPAIVNDLVKVYLYLFYFKIMLYFTSVGTICYYRTPIFVQLVTIFHFFQYRTCRLVDLSPGKKRKPIMVLSSYHGNSQISIHELSVVYVEKTKT